MVVVALIALVVIFLILPLFFDKGGESGLYDFEDDNEDKKK